MIGYMVIQNQIQLRTSSCMVIACIYSAYQVPRPTCFWNFQKWVGEPGYYSAYQVPRPKTSINGSGNLAVATIATIPGGGGEQEHGGSPANRLVDYKVWNEVLNYIFNFLNSLILDQKNKLDQSSDCLQSLENFSYLYSFSTSTGCPNNNVLKECCWSHGAHSVSDTGSITSGWHHLGLESVFFWSSLY